MVVDARLERLLGAIRSDAQLPIIITMPNAPTADDLARVRGAGARRARSVGVLVNGIGATATPSVIKAIGLVPGWTIFYDEPILAVPYKEPNG